MKFIMRMWAVCCLPLVVAGMFWEVAATAFNAGREIAENNLER